jgi:hypothetical protein
VHKNCPPDPDTDLRALLRCAFFSQYVPAEIPPAQPGFVFSGIGKIPSDRRAANCLCIYFAALLYALARKKASCFFEKGQKVRCGD